jgi:hypothetical protein
MRTEGCFDIEGSLMGRLWAVMRIKASAVQGQSLGSRLVVRMINDQLVKIANGAVSRTHLA